MIEQECGRTSCLILVILIGGVHTKMESKFSVTLAKIIQEVDLEIAYMPEEPENIKVVSRDITRPGLELTGFLDFFDNSRIMIFGNTENSYLNRFSTEQRYHVIERLFALQPPAIIVTRNIIPYGELMSAAEKYKIPVLRSVETTSVLSASLVSLLNTELAPRVTRHGVLVEVYGEGLLIVGDSGVGKSETAIELVKRGHRLIADDAVEIRKVSNKQLIGQSPANIRHFIELRGIGIINARRLFGMGSVKMSEKIDMVINLELWDSKKVYDRMGMSNEMTEILGNQVPILTIPVKPGRNLAVIIEVAAMNNRQRKMGYNAARELFQLLGLELPEEEDTGIKTIPF